MNKFLVVLAVLMVGGSAFGQEAWDTAFEATPSGVESKKFGDDRIRDFKMEVRRRAEVETCFGTNATNCPTGGDSGRARAGSARAFVSDTPPSALPVPDLTGSSVLDNGRLTFKPTTKELCIFRIGQWECFDLDPQPPTLPVPAPRIYETGIVSGSQAISNSAFSLPTSTGGSDGGWPQVTVPATGSWAIEVFADGTVCGPTAIIASIQLVSSPISAPAEIRSTKSTVSSQWSQGFSLHHVIPNPANGSTHSFGLRARGHISGLFWNTGTGCLVVSGEQTPDTRITVKLVPTNGIE